jgi:hypothetical protein
VVTSKTAQASRLHVITSKTAQAFGDEKLEALAEGLLYSKRTPICHIQEAMYTLEHQNNFPFPGTGVKNGAPCKVKRQLRLLDQIELSATLSLALANTIILATVVIFWPCIQWTKTT